MFLLDKGKVKNQRQKHEARHFAGLVPRKLLLSEAWKPGRHGVVQLDEHNEGDAHISIDQAKRRAYRIQALCREDSTFNGTHDVLVRIVANQQRVFRVAPADLQQNAEQQDVRPIEQQRITKRDELGQQ